MSNFQLIPGDIDGVRAWKHKVFEDFRGDLTKVFVSDSLEFGHLTFHTIEHFFTTSRMNVFRGMHMQSGIHPTSKIVSLVSGRATDYLLDLRIDSDTYGRLQIIELSDEFPKSIYIPNGVAHGYHAQAERTVISYRYDATFCNACDSGVNVKILEPFLKLPLGEMVLSERDRQLSLQPNEILNSEGHS